MDPNPMVRALDKLLDYTASGIGSVAGPLLAPWKARRETAARRILAQGEADALSIIAVAQREAREVLVPAGSDIQAKVEMAETVRQRIEFQEEKRHRNIESIVVQAAEQLDSKEVPNREPDHDWTARFFNYIQDISSEEMQSLWTKVLAGEIERPGSISIRSLSILRNLDQVSAKLFRMLCSCSVTVVVDGEYWDARVPSLGGSAGNNALAQFGLGFGNLNILNEHGLIISAYDSYFNMQLCIGFDAVPQPTDCIPFGFQDRHWILVPSDQRTVDQKKEGSEYGVNGVALTQAGVELAKIVDCEPVPEYHSALVKFFASENLIMTGIKSPGVQVN